VVMLFEARGVAGVMSLMIGLLVVQIVTVFALGIEPRQRSLEELKADDSAPVMLKEAS
jgi:MFS transporter, putative metabolite:H+ symporter